MAKDRDFIIEERDYLWQHFQFNAEQRIKAFNLFVVFAVFANGGVFAALEKKLHPAALLLIGAFIALLAGIFWMMDIRSKALLNLGVPGLKKYEEGLAEHSRLFNLDQDGTGGFFRYTVAFRILFVAQIIFGVAVATFGAAKWFGLLAPGVGFSAS